MNVPVQLRETAKGHWFCEEGTDISAFSLPMCLLENTVQGRTHPALATERERRMVDWGLGT